MPITMNWLDEDQTIYLVQYIGDWTWEEFTPTKAAADQAFELAGHSVDVIHDWSQQKHAPPNILIESKKLLTVLHRFTRLSVHVGFSPITLTMWHVFSRLYMPTALKERNAVAPTVDEAIKVIHAYRQKLTHH